MCYSYYRCDGYCDIDIRTRSSCGFSGFCVPPEYRESEPFWLSEVFNFVLLYPAGWSVSQDAAFEFIVFPLTVFIDHLFGSCHTAVHIIYPAKKPIVHRGMKKVIDTLDLFFSDYIKKLHLDQVIHLKGKDPGQFLDLYEKITEINRENREEEIPAGIGATVQLLHYFSLLNRSNTGGGTPRDAMFEKAGKLIENTLDRKVDLGFLAENLGISRSTLGRIFRKNMKISPQKYCRMRKVETARYLLTHTDLSIKEIAFRLGYSSQFHFSNDFYTFCGCSPRNYRKKEKNPAMDPEADL